MPSQIIEYDPSKEFPFRVYSVSTRNFKCGLSSLRDAMQSYPEANILQSHFDAYIAELTELVKGRTR